MDLTPDRSEVVADQPERENGNSTGNDNDGLKAAEARMRGEETLPSALLPEKYSTKTSVDLARLKARLKGQLLPREHALPSEEDDAVGGSPIYLSREAREVIAKLRRQKDEQEDWAKWGEVMFNTKVAMVGKEDGVIESSRGECPSASQRRRRSDDAELECDTRVDSGTGTNQTLSFLDVPDGFCKECHIPLASDPRPASLFIYLHAWRYTTEALGSYCTAL